MSLIKCHECSREISSQAATCPYCGAKKKASIFRKLILGGLAFMALLMVLLVAATSSLPNDPKPQPAKKKSNPPIVEVSNNDALIRVKNLATKDWKLMEIYINDTPPFTYRITVDAPAIGKSIDVPLNKFAKKDGTRFNPATTKVTQMWIGGGGYDFEKYNGAR